MASIEAFLGLDVRIGARSASAELVDLYEPDDLVGLQVVAVVKLPPVQVAGLLSERPVPAGGPVGR